MKDEDIEILEGFDAPQGSQPESVPDQNMQTPPVVENNSAMDFEKMVNEGNKIEEQPISNADQFQDNNYQNYNNKYYIITFYKFIFHKITPKLSIAYFWK